MFSNVQLNVIKITNQGNSLVEPESIITPNINDDMSLIADVNIDDNICYRWTINDKLVSIKKILVVDTSKEGMFNYNISVECTTRRGDCVEKNCSFVINCNKNILSPMTNVFICLRINNIDYPNNKCGSSINVHRYDTVSLIANVVERNKNEDRYSYQWVLNNTILSTASTIDVNTNSIGTFVYTVIVITEDHKAMSKICFITIMIKNNNQLNICVELHRQAHSPLMNHNQLANSKGKIIKKRAITVSSLCSNVLTAIASGGIPPYVYQWTFVPKHVEIEFDSNTEPITSAHTKISESGKYTMIITDNDNPPITKSRSIDVTFTMPLVNVIVAINNNNFHFRPTEKIKIFLHDEIIKIKFSITVTDYLDPKIIYGLYGNDQQIQIGEILLCDGSGEMKGIMYRVCDEYTIMRLILRTENGIIVYDSEMILIKIGFVEI